MNYFSSGLLKTISCGRMEGRGRSYGNGNEEFNHYTSVPQEFRGFSFL